MASAPASRSDAPPPGNAPAARVRDWRPWLWALAVLLFTLATAGAFTQGPRADPFAADSNAWQRFSRPLERNAFARLMATDATLNTVFALDEKRVWVAGTGGVILYSRDGGLSWQQGRIADAPLPLPLPAAEPPAAKKRPAEAAWLDWLPMGQAHAALPPQPELQVQQAPPSPAQSVQQQTLPEPLPNGFYPSLRERADSPVPNQLAPPAQTPPAPLANPAIKGLFFIDTQTGWAVGEAGTVLASRDGGASWQRQASGVPVALNGVFFTDARNGWAVGAQGLILATRDGGSSWAAEYVQVPKVSEATLHAIHGTDAAHLWAVGDYMLVLGRNAEGTWLPQQFGGSDSLRAVHLSGDAKGMAVGTRGAVAAMIKSDTWLARPAGVASDIGTLTALATPGGEVVLAGEGFIRMGSNLQQVVKQPVAFNALHFVDDRTGWAVGSGGTVLVSRDGGLSWQAQAGGMNTLFREVRGLVSGGLLAQSRGEAMLFSEDQGASWQVLGAQDSRRRLFDIAVPVTDILTGTPGSFLRGAEGAAAMRLSSSYRRLPAPWVWLLWGASLLLALTAAGLKPPPLAVGSRAASIEDLLAPDRPLRPGDPDPLGAGTVARSLAGFMGNRATEPPLTVAITGEWGTGKSSVMSLLKHQVEARGFRTVWFNAWHHQKGEQLLASLFANVREQGVPRLLSPAGPGFYWRLAQQRLRRRWFMGTLILAPLAACWGFVFGHDEAPKVLEGVWAAFADVFTALGDFKLPETTGDDWRKIFLGGGAVLPLLFLFRVLKAFGVNAGSLMKGAEQVVKPGRMEAQASARYQFAQEFAEVTTALADRRLVIFVDDLDRCDKENVVAMLETLNFLVCSGQCFIVLGLARSWVETCIKLNYAEMAKGVADTELAKQRVREATHRPAPAPPADADTVSRAGAEAGRATPEDFARNYLEKLINIEVPVPQPPGVDMAQRLLPGASGAAASPALPRISTAALAATPWALLLLAVAMAFTWGGQLQWRPAPPPVVVADPCGNYAESVARVLAPRLTEGQAPAPEPQHVDCVSRLLAQQLGAKSKPEAPAPTAAVALPPLPGQPSTPALSGLAPQPGSMGGSSVRLGDADTPGSAHWWLQGPLLLVLLLAALVAFNRKGRGLTEDSPVFKHALQAWLPVIALAHRTPRAVKRYLNWVRFLAMRARDGGAQLPRGYEAALVAQSAQWALRASDKSGDTARELLAKTSTLHALKVQEAGFAAADDAAVAALFEQTLGQIRVSG